jgi:hypothetical protein
MADDAGPFREHSRFWSSCPTVLRPQPNGYPGAARSGAITPWLA